MGPKSIGIVFSTLCAVVLATGCTPGSTRTPSPPAGAVPAGGLLAQLVVAEEDTGAHYHREEWGQDWDYRGDGCDTRELLLLQQGRGVQRGKGCTPVCPESAAPCWTSPYDGRTTNTARELEIDHRVAVREAARSRVVGTGKGAARVWTADQKRAFYEDMTNLVAITAKINSSKLDRDAGTWRPTHQACAFSTAVISTKVRYRLTADQREHDALRQMQDTCSATSN